MRYSIRNSSLKMDWEPAIRAAGELGFDGVELVVPQEPKIESVFSHEACARVLEWCAAGRCVISSLSCAGFRKVSFGLADAVARTAGVAYVEACLRACHALGGQAVLLPHFERQTINPTAEQEKHFIEGLRQCVPAAEREHVVIALETSFAVEPLQRIIRGVGSPWVGVYQDVANALFYGHDSVDMLKRLAKAIVMIHIKDTDQKMLGEGRVNWPACRDAIRAMRYDGWAVFETPPGDNPRDAAARNLRFARGLFEAAKGKSPC